MPAALLGDVDAEFPQRAHRVVAGRLAIHGADAGGKDAISRRARGPHGGTAPQPWGCGKYFRCKRTRMVFIQNRELQCETGGRNINVNQERVCRTTASAFSRSMARDSAGSVIIGFAGSAGREGLTQLIFGIFSLAQHANQFRFVQALAR